MDIGALLILIIVVVVILLIAGIVTVCYCCCRAGIEVVKCCCKCCRSKDDSKDKIGTPTTVVIDNSPIQNISGSINPQENLHVYDALRRNDTSEQNQAVLQTDSRVYEQVYDYVDQECNNVTASDQNRQRPAYPLPNSIKTTDSTQNQERANEEMVSESDQYDDTGLNSTGNGQLKEDNAYLQPVSDLGRQGISDGNDGYLKPSSKEKPYVDTTNGIRHSENGYTNMLQGPEYTTDGHTYTQLQWNKKW